MKQTQRKNDIRESGQSSKKSFSGNRDERMDTGKSPDRSLRSRVYTSLLLALLALVAVTAATVAWFSIADRARVWTMSLEIVADVDLRMDLDPHQTIDQYVKTLSFESIAKRIQSEKGFSMEETPLQPVTTDDAVTFTYENGSVVDDKSGAYLEVTLHFMAEKDMVVHLTSANSSESSTEDADKILTIQYLTPQEFMTKYQYSDADRNWAQLLYHTMKNENNSAERSSYG